MAQAAVELDKDTFSCAICLELLKDPVTLSCGHNYCISCVQNHWDGEEEKQIYSCPQCRHSFTPRPVVLKNTMLAHLVEQLEKGGLQAQVESSEGPDQVCCDVCSETSSKAVKSCLQCLASYCETHLEPHYQSAALSKHQLVAPTSKLQENICPEHNEVKKMFCHNDQQLLCVVCCMDQHKGHSTVSAAAERAERQKQLDTRRGENQIQIQDKEKELSRLHQEVLDLRLSADEAVKACEETFTRMILEMREKQCEVEQEIRTQQQKEEERAQELQNQLQRDISELQKTQAQLNTLALTPDHNQFLMDYLSLSLAEIAFPMEPQPLGSFVQVTAGLSTLSDLLQHTLKEGLQNISLAITQLEQQLPQTEEVQPQTEEVQPQTEEVQPQTEEPLLMPTLAQKEPVSRRDFLKFSRKVTLDPNTNHRKLMLSEGNRTATYDFIEYAYPNHANRFSYYYQVLSKEGFKGRCYWEVKWGDLPITIAVSYRDIKRKDNSHKCRFGFNDKSWALVCDKDDGYSFYINKVKHRARGPISSRIGVFLDHSAGFLSFYSVTKSMNLLFRVQGTFTQPLHAGLKFDDLDYTSEGHFPELR